MKRVFHTEPLYEYAYTTPNGIERVVCSFCENTRKATQQGRRRQAHWVEFVGTTRRKYFEWIAHYFCQECYDRKEASGADMNGLLPL